MLMPSLCSRFLVSLEALIHVSGDYSLDTALPHLFFELTMYLKLFYTFFGITHKLWKYFGIISLKCICNNCYVLSGVNLYFSSANLFVPDLI
jgi:hypothetical protein